MKLISNSTVLLFHFTVNPKSFGQTVENLFYTSFLMKDRLVGIEFDNDGIPSLRKLLNFVYICRHSQLTFDSDNKCQERRAGCWYISQRTEVSSRDWTRLWWLIGHYRHFQNQKAIDRTSYGREHLQRDKDDGVVWFLRHEPVWVGYVFKTKWVPAWGVRDALYLCSITRSRVQ